MSTLIRRDTPQWIFQTWVSFGIAISLTIGGAVALPSGSIDMMFMAMGMFFTLFSTLALSKMLRDNQHAPVDVPSWRLAAWTAFGLSSTMTAWGIMRLQCPDWHKYYLAASCLFLLSATFTLAKTLRDQHDAEIVDRSAGGEFQK
jgi:hypothetical protein